MPARRPVCTKCGVEMKCEKNGYVIGYESGRRYDSDRYECHKCGNSVAITAPEHHTEPSANGIPAKADCMITEDF
jgi:hypothetical protein